MKKLLLLAICSLLLFTGCGNKPKEKEADWNSKFQASDFSFKKESMPKVIGSVKNITSKDCSSVYVTLIYKNGSLEREGNNLISDGIKAGETVNVEFFAPTEIEDSIDNYTISVKKIWCFDEIFDK